MRHTKKLTISEYSSPFYYDSKENLLKLVQKEAEILYPVQKVVMPKFKRSLKMPLTAGLYNFIRQLKP